MLRIKCFNSVNHCSLARCRISAQWLGRLGQAPNLRGKAARIAERRDNSAK